MNTPEYAADKAANFPDRILDLRANGHAVPVQVLVSPSDLCNHDCPWCSFRDEKLPTSKMFPLNGRHNPDRRMSTGQLFNLLDSLAWMGVRAVQFTGGGEPTLHKDLASAIRHVRNNAMESAVVTNGTGLDDEQVEAMTLCSWVRVSVDAGSVFTYSKLRRVKPDAWTRLWENVTRLVDAGVPGLSCSFVAQRENYEEVGRFVSMARSHGVRQVRVTGLIHPDGDEYFLGWGKLARAAIEQVAAVNAGDDGFRVVDDFDNRLVAMSPPTNPACWYQHLAPFVGADLKVYRCCNTAYTEVGCLGSLESQTFANLWESHEVRAALGNFDATKCSFCIFKDKNRLIDRLVHRPTGHTCFV